MADGPVIYALILMFAIEGPGPGIRVGPYPDLPACLRAGDAARLIQVDDRGRSASPADRVTFLCEPIRR